MSCAEMRAALVLDESGDAAATERRRLAQHIAECGDCRAFAAATTPSLAPLRTAPPLHDRDYATVRAAVLARVRASRQPQWFAWPMAIRFAMTAALLTMLIAVGAFVALRPTRRDEPRDARRDRAAVSPHTPTQATQAQHAAAAPSTSAETSITSHAPQAQPSHPIAAPSLSGQASIASSQRATQPHARRSVATPSASTQASIASLDRAKSQASAATAPTRQTRTATHLARHSRRSRDAAQPEELRIDIQTDDPDIRIIWIVNPKPVQQEESNESR